MRQEKTYRLIATIIQAIANCHKANNDLWLEKHESRLDQIMRDYAPSGAGIDSGTKLDRDRSTTIKLVFTTSYHHMNDSGMYDGWTDHVVIVWPSFTSDYDLTISGRDRNQIKDYLHETFAQFLSAELVWDEKAERYVDVRYAFANNLPQRCLDVYVKAASALGPDLSGGSVLDLCADNLQGVTLDELKLAIKTSDVAKLTSPRIQQAIANY